MTRPTVLDMDLVVVPREATLPIVSAYSEKQDEYGISHFANARVVYPAMLSASPYPTAWDDVRKYVEGLERERDDKDACLREVIRHAMNEGNTYREDDFGAPYVVNTRAEAAEARIAELEKEKHAALTMIAMVEKRLADAERVIEPFAERASDYHNDYPDDLAVVVQLGHLRAARAYMEGK